MYNIIYEMSHQSRFDAQYWMLGAGALGRPRGMVWGGKREEGSGWGTHVCLWRIHFDIWQNQYNIVKFKNKIKLKQQQQQKQRHYFANKSLSSQGYGFSCGHAWMWELDCEEGWVPSSSPGWSRVFEGETESATIYIFIKDIKSNRMRIARRKIQWRKEAE